MAPTAALHAYARRTLGERWMARWNKPDVWPLWFALGCGCSAAVYEMYHAFHNPDVRVRKNIRSPGQGFGGVDETESVAGGAKTTEEFRKEGERFHTRSVFRSLGKASPTDRRVPGL